MIQNGFAMYPQPNNVPIMANKPINYNEQSKNVHLEMVHINKC